MWKSNLSCWLSAESYKPGNSSAKAALMFAWIFCCSSRRVGASSGGRLGSLAWAMNPPSGLDSMRYVNFVIMRLSSTVCCAIVARLAGVEGELLGREGDCGHSRAGSEEHRVGA